MRELKILHTSDILAGSAADTLGVLDEVCRDLQMTGLAGQVDYLVISGNITVDGSKSSFDRAHERLLNLANCLLRPDEGAVRLNRVIIVPGRRDVQATQDLSNFKRFHDNFFAEEIERQRVDPFNEREAIFRELKDLTLIGVCHWKTVNGDRLIRTMDDVGEVVLKAKKRVLGLEYTNRTPTLLVSADNIAFDGDTRYSPSFKVIQADFKNSFRTTLHLFGASDAVCYLPSPLAFDHVGLGTGVRGASGFWPFTLNLIQIRKEALRENRIQGAPPFLSSRVFQRASQMAPLESHDWLDGHLDVFYQRERHSRDVLYAPLLRSLEEEFKSNSFIAITGFPGAGKSGFFEFMKSQRKLIDQKVHVIALRLDRYDNFAERLKEEEEKLKSVVLDADTIPLLMIHDTRFARLRNDQKTELKTTLDKNDPFTLISGLGRVLLLLTTADYTLGITPGISLPLLPLGTEAVRELVKQYSCCALVEETRLGQLTGGYAGFSELILKAAAQKFGSLSGAEPMYRGVASLVMRQALHSEPIVNESRWHRKSFELINAGEDICSHIENEIERMRSNGDPLSSATLAPVSICIERLKEKLKDDPVKMKNVDKALDRLSRLGILAKDESAKETTYKVRVLVPFLNLEEAKSMGQDEEEEVWPEISADDLRKRADVAIITPLEEEREAVLRKLPNSRQLDPAEGDARVYYFSNLPVKFPSGAKGAYRVVVTDLTNMGQVDGAVAAAGVIRRWRPRLILLVGIAGGVKERGVGLGDILIADQIAYYGFETILVGGVETRWRMMPVDARLLSAARNFSVEKSRPLITAPRPAEGELRRHRGTIATGDAVVADEMRLEALRKKVLPKLIGVEMEAWGVGSAALQAGNPIPFFMVRGVSDLADNEKYSHAVENWRPYACDAAASYAVALLKSGPLPMRRRSRATEPTSPGG